MGYVEALRTYVEFTDGSHRGLYISEIGIGGYMDEDFDAVNTMVVNWHKILEEKDELNARLAYRKIYPEKSEWEVVQGETFDFWHRNEALVLINKVRERSNAIPLLTLPLKDFEEERARELLWEGHRMRDMIRFGSYFNETWKFKNSITPDYRGIYPIPRGELSSNPNLSQNLGY